MRTGLCHSTLALGVAVVLAAGCLPQRSPAAEAGTVQDVSCKLPGEIHSMGGHSMMAAGRIVQTSPADCRQRGGEYTVAQTLASSASTASPASPLSAEDRRIVSCSLPPDTRQLGEKARYKHYRHSIRTTRSDCENRGGKVYVPRKVKATRK